jgi:hypothetical protein
LKVCGFFLNEFFIPRASNFSSIDDNIILGCSPARNHVERSIAVHHIWLTQMIFTPTVLNEHDKYLHMSGTDPGCDRLLQNRFCSPWELLCVIFEQKEDQCKYISCFWHVLFFTKSIVGWVRQRKELYSMGSQDWESSRTEMWSTFRETYDQIGCCTHGFVL